MTSTERKAADEPVEDVRKTFRIRLHGEAKRLAVLADSLASSEGETISVFADLEEFAHGLRGAAGVFELLELSADAKSLELAVAAASNVRGRRDDRFVLAALHRLTIRLASMNSSPPSPEAD